jgi:predicted amidophosphoribosyltransferase
MLASAIASRVVGSRSMNLLEAGATADQAELGIQERARNLVGTMKLRFQIRPELLGSSTIILVDDVVTTGATLLEAQRALIAAGLQVGGFTTFAETLRLFAPKAKNRSTFALTQSMGQEGKEATQNAS